ncbi:MAG: tetratricopeptide repeat protein [Phyllobacteriaceae bacterium]|nr:tetratricopeptide repeat protein [Phyllobacteriaceae bacterium]
MRSTERALLAARRSLEVGNAENARKSAAEVLAAEPDNAEAQVLMVSALAALKRWGEAESALKSVLAADPDGIRGLLLSAQIADRGGARRKATLAAADAVLERDPDQPYAWYLKAIAEENLGKYPAAEQSWRRCLEGDPDDVDYLAGFADFLGKTGRKEEAEPLLARAVALQPDNLSVLVAAGTQDLRAGRIDEARDRALWALRENAEDPSAIALLVSIKTRQNPVMGIWWRWASLMERLSMPQRWGVIIGLYFVWQVFRRALLTAFPPMVQLVASLAWFAFCVLTWVGPSLFRRAVARELAGVKIKRF